MLMPMASHDQNCHVPSPFDHLNLTNGMVSLMNLLAHVTLGAASVALHIPHCLSHLDLMNTMVLLTMLFTLHDADASAKCQMTQKIKLHLILMILNLQMQWYC